MIEEKDNFDLSKIPIKKSGKDTRRGLKVAS